LPGRFPGFPWRETTRSRGFGRRCVPKPELGNEEEIKSFIGSSPLTEFHQALGQFMNYREALANQDPERILYLAVPVDTYETFFLSQFGQYAVERFGLKLLVYKVQTEVIATWRK